MEDGWNRLKREEIKKKLNNIPYLGARRRGSREEFTAKEKQEKRSGLDSVVLMDSRADMIVVVYRVQ